jgi:hypothetical protein
MYVKIVLPLHICTRMTSNWGSLSGRKSLPLHKISPCLVLKRLTKYFY